MLVIQSNFLNNHAQGHLKIEINTKCTFLKSISRGIEEENSIMKYVARFVISLFVITTINFLNIHQCIMYKDTSREINNTCFLFLGTQSTVIDPKNRKEDNYLQDCKKNIRRRLWESSMKEDTG